MTKYLLHQIPITTTTLENAKFLTCQYANDVKLYSTSPPSITCKCICEPRGRGGCQVALAVHVHYTIHVTKLQYLSAGNMPGTIPTPRFALWQIMPVPSFDKGGGQH